MGRWSAAQRLPVLHSFSWHNCTEQLPFYVVFMYIFSLLRVVLIHNTLQHSATTWRTSNNDSTQSWSRERPSAVAPLCRDCCL